MSVAVVNGEHRFEGILRGNASAKCDQSLLDRPSWAVAPSIGAIVPGWLLIIPRRSVLNFRDWTSRGFAEPSAVIDDLLRHLGLRHDEIIWFEHGPNAQDTVVGCGLDHAHIHVLIRPSFDFECFEDAIRKRASLDWRAADTGVDYSLLAGAGSYLIAGSGTRVIAAADVEAVGSQFLRRVVASLVGKTDGWDYKRSPHLSNVEATVTTFRALEASALHG